MTLIKLETAKLAKEKGFNEGCSYFYDSYSFMKTTYDPFLQHQHDINCRFRCTSPITNQLLELDTEGFKLHPITVPTQSELQKWLREEFDIHVWLMTTPNNFKGNKYIPKKFRFNLYGETWNPRIPSINIDSDIYEEGLEEWLLEALKLIKN